MAGVGGNGVQIGSLDPQQNMRVTGDEDAARRRLENPAPSLGRGVPAPGTKEFCPTPPQTTSQFHCRLRPRCACLPPSRALPLRSPQRPRAAVQCSLPLSMVLSAHRRPRPSPSPRRSCRGRCTSTRRRRRRRSRPSISASSSTWSLSAAATRAARRCVSGFHKESYIDRRRRKPIVHLPRS